MKVDKDPSAILLLCENFYKANRGDTDYSNSMMFDLIRVGLEAYLKGIAIIHEGLYQGWKADLNNPGYLVRIDAPAVMRAPYHLVPAFPTHEALNGIWKLSRSVKTCDESIICLSGSGAVLRSSVSISDFDFCEYVQAEVLKTSDKLLSRQYTEAPLIFQSLKFNSQSWLELSSEDTKDAVASIDPDIEALSYAKLDYLAKAQGFRPSDVSNVMIFCDEFYQSASMKRTFSAQEAHLDASVLVPNELCHPYEVGRYIYWLREQAKTLLEQENYVKFFKRSLSLTRFCFLNDLSSHISTLIRTSPECMEEEIRAIDEITMKISAMNFTDRELWLQELTEERGKAERDLCARRAERGSDPVSDIANEVYLQLDSFFDGTARAA